MSILLCALALISSNRPVSRIGTTTTERYAQASGRCVEDLIRVGKTWLDDEVLWRTEVSAELCQ